VRQVGDVAEAVLHGPGGPAGQHPVDAAGVELEVLAVRADAGRDVAEERLDEIA